MSFSLVGQYDLTESEVPFLVPHLFTSGRLILEVSSAFASINRWRRAGFITELIEVPGVGVCRGFNRRIFFERIAIEVPALLDSYQLEFISEYWIQALTLKIYESDMPLTKSVMVTVNYQKSNIATSSSIAASVTSVSLLAANANRVGATIYNRSNSSMFLKFGVAASATNFTVKVDSGDYYELPNGFTGALFGIWEAANGSCNIEELS